MEACRETAVVIVGIDLAWGERNPDGITLLHFENGLAGGLTMAETELTRGDEAIFDRLDSLAPTTRVLVAIDAPTRCRNDEGSRPVDKECSARYRRYEAGCHPVNRRLCVRPLRIADRFERAGFAITTGLENQKTLTEVYPHPATIRFFGLDKTIKYKKGPVAAKRIEFARYQKLLLDFLERELPELAAFTDLKELLATPWKKAVEDQVDSVLCAVIGYWHLKHQGQLSEVLGDDKTGHLLIPRPCPNWK